MVVMIIHIAYITCLVTNDAWHANGVIVEYKIHHGAGRISYFAEPACGWLVRLWARSRHVAFNGTSNTVVGWNGYGRGLVP